MKMFQILNLYKKCFQGFLCVGTAEVFTLCFLLFSLVCSISDPDKRLQALWVVCDMYQWPARPTLGLLVTTLNF